MAKKIGLRIANNVDITKVFSANLLSAGGRGIDNETMALESHSNNVCPTIRTITNFVLICEPMNKETNEEPKICAMRGRSDGEWHESEHEQRIECREDGVTNTITGVSKYNMVAEPIIIANTAGFGQCYESKDVSPTVKSSAFQYNNALIEPIEQELLGWVRDEKGNVIKRPVVDVANTVTAGKRDNTQNYVKEQIPLNTDQDGLATTVTTAHLYSGNIVDPKRGQKEMGVLEFCDNHVKLKTATKDGTQQMEYGGVCDIAYPNSETRRGRIQEGGSVSPTLTCESRDAQCVPEMPFRVRRLTERELFRLMDLSEEDIDKIQAAGISKTQQAKMAGNSICVNVLYHIFRKLYVDTDEENEQLSLF